MSTESTTAQMCIRDRPNPVASMRGGTLNWKLSGYDLEFNRTDRTAPPSFQALAFAREHANMLAQKHDISFVDAAELQAWQEEAEMCIRDIPNSFSHC